MRSCDAFLATQGGGQVVRALLLIKSIIILPPDPLSEVPCGSLSLGKSLELSNLLLKKLNLIENFNFTLNLIHIATITNFYSTFSHLFFRVICL